jgi:hypothetical protein
MEADGWIGAFEVGEWRRGFGLSLPAYGELL